LETVLRRYVICGPFKHSTLVRDGVESFFQDHLVGIGGEASAKLYKGLEVGGAVCSEVDADQGGAVDLAKLYGEEFRDFWRLNYGVAYAYTEVEGLSGDYVLLLGAEDYVSVFHNGRRVYTRFVARRYSEGFDVVPLRLAGKDSLLFKVGRLAGRWVFSAVLRAADAPFYLNERRVIAPTPLRGSIRRFWISIHITAVRDMESLSVECLEDDMWEGCGAGIENVIAGERLHIPLAISPKRPVDPAGDSLEIPIKVSGGGVERVYRLRLRVAEKGFHRVETYRSSSDGSVHSFGVKPPIVEDPSRRYAVIISLHGFKGHPYFSELYGDKDWCYIVSPTARDSEVPYREAGLLEILEVLSAVRERYPIDSSRIYLTGHSMGGYGTWYVSTRVPHLFAAVAPLSSRGDMRETIEALRGRKGWEGIAELLSLYNPAEAVENLFNTPVFVSHGSQDRIVPVEASRRMVKALSEMGYEVQYEEVEGADHVWGSVRRGSRYGLDCLDRETIEAFLRSRSRAIPRAVRGVVVDPRFPRIWWLILRRRGRGPSRARGEVLSSNKLVVRDLENVASLEVDLAMLAEGGLIDPAKPLELEVAGAVFKLEGGAALRTGILRLDLEGDRVCLHEEEDLLRCASKGSSTLVVKGVGEPPRRPSKAYGPSGPFMDVFNRRPLIAMCTGAGLEEVCRRASLGIQAWWNSYSQGFVRVVRDSEVLSRGLDEAYSVIAVGSPYVNRFLERVADEIPVVRFESPDTFTLRGRRYSGAHLGLAMVYPSPSSRDLYIAIVGGTSADPIEALYRLDFTLVPDYLVYDSRLVGIDAEGFIESGFFDDEWR